MLSKNLSNIESGEIFFKDISFHQQIEKVNAAHAPDRQGNEVDIKSLRQAWENTTCPPDIDGHGPGSCNRVLLALPFVGNGPERQI